MNKLSNLFESKSIFQIRLYFDEFDNMPVRKHIRVNGCSYSTKDVAVLGEFSPTRFPFYGAFYGTIYP